MIDWIVSSESNVWLAASIVAILASVISVVSSVFRHMREMREIREDFRVRKERLERKLTIRYGAGSIQIQSVKIEEDGKLAVEQIRRDSLSKEGSE